MLYSESSDVYTISIFMFRPFCLENLDDYETHFTVMNYGDTELKQVHCHDFIPMFEQQYQDYKWIDVQADLYGVISKVFEAAGGGDPPNAIIPFQQARAIYGVDIMLEWAPSNSDGKRKMAPKLLEVNYCPDCVRACKYHPEFFNDIFAFFFLGHSPEQTKMTRLL
jgi:tubulin--tyrosine ligase-like protein 12